MEKVSIVVPVYNAKKYIKKTVRSLLKQTYGNISIILVDDGSTDGSGDICDAFAKKDPRVRVLHKKNGGSFAARRDGVALCGDDELVTHCDADDVMDKNAIKNLVQGMGDSDICVGNIGSVWRRIRLRSKSKRKAATVSHDEFMDKYYCSWFGVSDVPVTFVAKLYRASLMKQAFDQVKHNVMFMGEDLSLTIYAFPLAKSVSFIEDTVYYYRPCGGTRKYVPKLYDAWNSLYTFRTALIRERGLPDWYKTLLDIELCHMVFSCFTNYLKKKDWDETGLRKEIDRLCDREEVKAAANNPKIEITKFPRVQLIKAGDKDGIFDYVMREAKKAPLKRLIKKIAVKFA